MTQGLGQGEGEKKKNRLTQSTFEATYLHYKPPTYTD